MTAETVTNAIPPAVAEAAIAEAEKKAKKPIRQVCNKKERKRKYGLIVCFIGCWWYCCRYQNK